MEAVVNEVLKRAYNFIIMASFLLLNVGGATASDYSDSVVLILG